MKGILSAAGALILALLGIVATTSPTAATSNFAGWLEWIGVSRVPAFLSRASTDRVVQLVLVAVITWLVARWWFGKPPAIDSAVGSSSGDRDAALADDLLLMAERLAHMRRREWWDRRDPNTLIVADLEALLVTLDKAGFDIPFGQPTATGEEAIDMYSDYMVSVGSFLRSGHGLEARDRARSLAARYPRSNDTDAQAGDAGGRRQPDAS